MLRRNKFILLISGGIGFLSFVIMWVLVDVTTHIVKHTKEPFDAVELRTLSVIPYVVGILVGIYTFLSVKYRLAKIDSELSDD